MTELAEVMARLLAPDGCPWDQEQTLASLRPFLVEETYEVLDALDREDVDGHREELGDLAMQIVFQAALREREGAFTLDDVLRGIVAKLVHRHPHVFARKADMTSAEVLAQWEEIKAAEKAARGLKRARTLGDVPIGMPALARAQKLGHKAGKVGFDWPGYQGSLAKVREEVEEIAEVCAEAPGPARDARAHHEIGDLLFAVVNLARKVGIDAEVALTDASGRFTRRFGYIEDRLAETNQRPADATLEQMDALWEQAKLALADRPE